MKIEQAVATAAETEEVRAAPRHKPLVRSSSRGRPPGYRLLGDYWFPEQRPKRGQHPHSRAALRPWQKGQSGNPAGRKPGRRDNGALRAERLGKKAMRDLPFLVARIEGWVMIKDFGAHRDRLLELVANVLERQPPKIQKRDQCCRCNIKLFEPVVAIPDSTGQTGWYHWNCVLPELEERTKLAQAVVDTELLAPQRTP
jgi:hypothetical protein